LRFTAAASGFFILSQSLRGRCGKTKSALFCSLVPNADWLKPAYRERIMLDEFKKFAMRGNVVDLAVGVIIGAAFGAIVASLVNDIIMPVIGAVTGGLDFSNYYTALSSKVQPGLSYADAKKTGRRVRLGPISHCHPELFDRRVGVIHGDQGNQQTPNARGSEAAGANTRGETSYGNTGPSKEVAAHYAIICPDVLLRRRAEQLMA
jgi:hypothetical protein